MKYDDLKLLEELREKGSITDAEFQREKAKILNEEDTSASNTKSKPLFGLDERSYIILMHLSQFAGFILVGLGFIAPIGFWLVGRDQDPKGDIDMHGKNIINFMISMLIYGLLSIPLCFIMIGFLIWIALGVIIVVSIIYAAVKASNGEFWRYPLTITFFK